MDDEIARRIGEETINLKDYSEVLAIVSEHNQLCPQGYEISIPMIVNESEAFLQRNAAAMSREEFVKVVAGLAVSGFLPEYPVLTEFLESEIKKRITQLNVMDSIYILKAFVQTHSGSEEGYRTLERHIGINV